MAKNGGDVLKDQSNIPGFSLLELHNASFHLLNLISLGYRKLKINTDVPLNESIDSIAELKSIIKCDRKAIEAGLYDEINDIENGEKMTLEKLLFSYIQKKANLSITFEEMTESYKARVTNIY